MITTAKELRDRLKSDLAELQNKCQHIPADWAIEEWAPAHYTGRMLKVCQRCEKILEVRESDFTFQQFYQGTNQKRTYSRKMKSDSVKEKVG